MADPTVSKLTNIMHELHVLQDVLTTTPGLGTLSAADKQTIAVYVGKYTIPMIQKVTGVPFVMPVAPNPLGSLI